MKIVCVIIFVFINIFLVPIYSQNLSLPTQYRRGIDLNPSYQSYEQKYFDKNLNEIKQSLFPLESTGIWTELNPNVPRVDYLGVHFVNKDSGWACGDLGALIKTTDGGNSWTVSQTNTTTPILKIRSFNGQIVIASGFDGLILRSTDAGETFTQVTSSVTGDMWGLQMLNDTLGWACGNFNSLIKTTDGGQSWQRIFTTGYTSDYWWIEFLNENYGFIAGNGYVLRTTNGGINWDIIPAGDSYPLFSLDVIDSLHIAAAGYGGFNYAAKNLYSSDGGNNWITGDTLTTEAVNCIQYVNPDTGYLVMTNVSARKTTNRGQDWTTIQSISDNYELQLLNNNTGYSVGTGLQIKKAESNLDVWNRLIINDNFADVFFVTEEKGFAISNVLYRTTDGGNFWEVSGPGGSSVIFVDSLTGFIGNPGSIWKTTNEGDNWYQTIGSNGAGKIFFIDETTGWAIRSNIIYKTNDRGDNWGTQFTAPSSVTFTNIHFVDSLNGWTSGGRPYKTTDGGNNWVQQTNTTIWNSDDVYFKNITIGWIIKRTLNSSLVKTTDTGISWNIVPEIISAFKFHYFPDPQHWMINGSHRYITEDGGSTFIDVTDDVPTGFNSFSSVTDKLGYAVGGLGLVLRYDDTSYVPVELTSFTSSVNGCDLILSWQTATETNNQGFEIQRLKDLKIEKLQDWESVGFVSGNGTITEPKSYSFVDRKLQAGKYQYRLKQIDYNGTFEYSNTIEVEINSPTKFSLGQNYPNPFNPNTIIQYAISNRQFVTLKVYDVLGKEVATLVNEEKPAGNYEIKFDVVQESLPAISSGIYFYQLKAGEFAETKKMILLK